MKSLLLVLCVLVACSYGKVPDYLQPLICKTSDLYYEKCLLNSFEKARPYLIKGIKELRFPPMDPFMLPLLTVNRTLNNVVSINAVCKNIKIDGGRNTIIEDIKADPIKHTGEMRLTLPWSYMEMEYDVTGQLLTIPLQSKGFFKGNFSNIQFHVKGSLDTYKRDGDEYFRVKKVDSKIVVGDGWIKLTSKNPDLQFGASYFPTCYRNDPEINKCLLDATNQVRPYLAKGVPELKIPPFEPFTIPEIYLEHSSNVLNFKATLKNLVAHGLTKYDFSRLDFDIPNLQFFSESKIPDVQVEAEYSATGTVLGAPIDGNGRFTSKIDSCDVYTYQKYKETTLKDGKIHLDAIITNSSISVSGPKFELQGLLNGNEQFIEATNTVISDNVDQLYADLKPVLENTINKIMEDLLLKSFMENIPWDDLFPVKK